MPLMTVELWWIVVSLSTFMCTQPNYHAILCKIYTRINGFIFFLRVRAPYIYLKIAQYHVHIYCSYRYSGVKSLHGYFMCRLLEFLSRYSKSYSWYSVFIKRHQCLIRRLMSQEYLKKNVSTCFSKVHWKISRPCW